MKILTETVKSKDELVGIEFTFDKEQKKSIAKAYFPIGYLLVKEEIDIKDRNDLRNIYDLLNIINRYKDKNESIINVNQTKELKTENFPFSSYFEIVRYYIDNGYYKEREIEYKTDTRGKINWKRTIQQKRAFIQNSSPVYTDFVVRKNRMNENNIITEIHKYCVAFSLSRIGWYFGIDFSCENLYLKLENDNAFRNLGIATLKDKLHKTNNDKLKRLFSSMLLVLEDKDLTEHGFTDWTVGTKSFNVVWENVIDDLFGINDDIRKTYNPVTKWNDMGVSVDSSELNEEEKEEKKSKKFKNATLRIDTIMENEKDNMWDLYILDSKYYKEGNLPSGADINKQITYGDSIYSKINKWKLNNIYNAFVLPCNYENLKDKENIDENKIDENIKILRDKRIAKADWRPLPGEINYKKEYLNIRAIYFDTQTLLDLVYKSETEKQVMKEKLCEAIKN